MSVVFSLLNNTPSTPQKNELPEFTEIEASFSQQINGLNPSVVTLAGTVTCVRAQALKQYFPMLTNRLPKVTAARLEQLYSAYA